MSFEKLYAEEAMKLKVFSEFAEGNLKREIARAEAAEKREAVVRHALEVAWHNIDPFQITDEDERTIIAALEAKP